MASVLLMMAAFGTAFAILDMAFNGARDASAAPFWFVCAGIGFAGSWWAGAL